MEDYGCILALVLFGAATIAATVAIVSSNARNRAAAEAAARERGKKIHKLLEEMPTAAHRKQVASDLNVLLSGPAIGYRPELIGQERWFLRAAPTLRTLLNDAEGTTIVEWHFSCFSFPNGYQQELLRWLATLLNESEIDLEAMKRIVERALSSGGAKAVEWFYRRTLEALRLRSADPKFKTFALQVGRLSYAFSRPRRNPTVYDEQAIANDIAMNSELLEARTLTRRLTRS